MGLRRNVLGAVAVLALLGSVVPAAAAPSSRAALAGSVPSWATSANFKKAADASQYVGFRVYLGWRNQSQAEVLANAVSNPKSSSYGQYLTPAQFRQQFAPTQAQVGAVQNWLRSQGFSVEYTPMNNHYVSAEGTVAQAAAAFQTSFGTYSVQGLTLRSPSTLLSVPSDIAPLVSGVLGLDQSAALVHTDMIKADPGAPPSPAFVNAPPCSTYWAQQTTTAYTNPYGTGALPWAPCGYTPAQVKGAYGLSNTSLTGSGVKVAIIDAYASPTIVQDVNQWSTNRGLPTLKAGQLQQIVAPGTYNHPESLAQDPQGWYGEETLDVEAVHGMAPDATIIYIGSPNNYQDLDAALNHLVDRRTANIVTNSYGFLGEFLPPGYIKPYLQTMIQGVAEGIGIYFSSGDSGDETQNFNGTASTDWPASSPYVTAVGGTSLAVGAGNSYDFETYWGTKRSRWNTSCSSTPTWCPTPPGVWLYGGGGGVSRLFGVPSYQQGLNLTSFFNTQGHSGRVVPDVSAVGDPNTGYLIGQTQTFPDGTQKYSEFRIGGTSLSSPLMAGIVALVDQSRSAAGKGPLGFANPALYQLNSGVFHDVVKSQSAVAVLRNDYFNSVPYATPIITSLRTTDQVLTLQSVQGYDDATGLGTPRSGFVSALAAK